MTKRNVMMAVVVMLVVSALVAVVRAQSPTTPVLFQLLSEDTWGTWHLVRLRHKESKECFVAVWTNSGGVAITAADRAVCADEHAR